MATVAEQLKAARAAQRLSLQRVAEVTRMRVEHVQAIESGNYDEFVAPVYLRGFVRAYARFVRLDERAVLEQLDRELGREAKPEEVAPAPSVAEKPSKPEWPWFRDFRWRTIVPVFGGMVIAVVAYFMLRSPNGSVPAGQGGFPPALYPNPEIAASDVLPLPPLPPSAE
jgi:cytoskeletal protein RodZ